MTTTEVDQDLKNKLMNADFLLNEQTRKIQKYASKYLAFLYEVKHIRSQLSDVDEAINELEKQISKVVLSA